MNDKMTPRRAAWEVLNKFDPQQQNAGKLIDEISRRTNNRSAVVEIALGTIRNLIFIDNLIAICSGRAVKNIQPKILNCLRTAVYELIFTDQAQYAIVNEAVELSKKSISKKSAGFTNAILRKIISSIVNKNAELSKCDFRKTLPFNEKIGCAFNIDILADENKDKAEHLCGAFSLPKWFIEEIIAQFGYQQAKSICLGSNRRPSIYARPNLLKVEAIELANILKSQEVDCELAGNNMVKLNKTGNIAELESFKAGLFTIQDLTANSVVTFLHPQPGWKVIDICAAPGTKTTQLAEMMNDKGTVIATDKDSSRLQKINENVQRLGITSVKILSYEDFLKEANEKSYKADAILLDVPCSNTGVLAKRPEVRFRLNKKQVAEITKTQFELLQFASSLVTKGGKICYSTCSILKEENSEIVQKFLSGNSDYLLETEKLTVPNVDNFDCDGGYCAILTRK